MSNPIQRVEVGLQPSIIPTPVAQTKVYAALAAMIGVLIKGWLQVSD